MAYSFSCRLTHRQQAVGSDALQALHGAVGPAVSPQLMNA